MEESNDVNNYFVEKRYPTGPDDERLMKFSKEQLRLIVWSYACQLNKYEKGIAHIAKWMDAEDINWADFDRSFFPKELLKLID